MSLPHRKPSFLNEEASNDVFAKGNILTLSGWG